MIRGTLTRLAGASVLAFALAACSSDGSTGTQSRLTAEESADAAHTVGDAVAEDVAEWVAGEGMIGGGASPDVSADQRPGGDCPYDAGLGRFVCAPVSRDGLTFNRSFALFDAVGQPMEQYHHRNTAAANFRWSVTGTVTRENWTGTIARDRDMTVSGMLGLESRRTWNGSGTSTIEAQFTGGQGTRSYTHSVNATAAGVVVAVPRAMNAPWPLSGTVTANVTSNRPRFGGGTVQFTAVVTFNGTRIVPLAIGEREFCLDLALRRLSPLACR